MKEEIVDPKSGAILFKRTKETKMLYKLSQRVQALEDRIKELEDKLKEDS